MAAAASSPEQMLKQAAWLHQRLVQLNNEISQKTPEEQLKQLELVFLNERRQLDELQKKVNSFFSRLQFLDGGECEEISNKLSESVTLIDGFSQLQEQLINCATLFAEADNALQSKIGSDLRSLHQRVTQKMTAQNINPGLANELALLQKNLSDALGGPVRVQPSPETPQSTNASKISELIIEYGDLWRRWCSTSVWASSDSTQSKKNEKTFELFLPFYKKVRSFSQAHPTDDLTFQKVNTNTYEILYDAYQAQRELEKNINQGQRSTTSANTNTQKLVDELKNGVAESDVMKSVEVVNKTNAAFAKLTDGEKEQFYNALIKIKGHIPKAMLSRQLNLWSASLEDKCKAAQNAFSGNGQSAAPTAPSKAEAMLKALEAVTNSTPAQGSNNFSAINQVVQRRAQSLQQLMQAAQPQSEENIGMVGQLLNSVNALQECLSLFKRSTSQDTLGTVVQTLKPLNCPCIFAMSGTQPDTIGKRPFFHIYQIHCVETPQVVQKDDPNYGEKAFANENGATYTQRIRALHRSAAEVCLSGLEEAINFEDWPSVIDSLKILEAIEPEGTKNYAHLLFGAYHRQHSEAREKNNALVDPNDPKFGGEFGRKAFIMSGEDIPSSIKIEAIKKVIDSLKEVWKI